MASAEHRKRGYEDDLSQKHRPDRKKIKSTSRVPVPPNFSPEFWDNLSKVPLTRRALRELNRRNSSSHGRDPATSVADITNRARLARQGGPDLRHLRGCPEPHGASCTTAPSRWPSRQTIKSTESQAAGHSSSSKSTSVYDAAFEQHMIDNGIYPENYDHPNGRMTPEPDNLEQLRAEFSAPRASLSPSQFPDSAFRDFRKKDRAVSGSTVKDNVIPIIAGNADIPNEGGLCFSNIESMTEETTVRAVPDFFDGARAGSIHGRIRNAGVDGNLNHLIIPTNHASAPVAPNFFFETNVAGGGVDVALQQTVHDGAIGTRAMHALQNYSIKRPTFDGNAYTYSSTYLYGHLKLFAHHSTATPDGLPEYHMTQVGAYSLTGNRDAFVEGATAFRNARDVAQRHRDSFIQTANTRACQFVDAPPEPETILPVVAPLGAGREPGCEVNHSTKL
ncbi:hypothetical protein B0J18DRAFT_371554 [Chaetomium sp. MPI-SDFR-AT-0129]|nr:hypothetical protein B0J18DRAFT_371554 [Chaetomium sp. MPI-SDFR-AT-0129]